MINGFERNLSSSDMYLYGPKSPGAEAKNAAASYLEAGLALEDVLRISAYN